MSSRVLVVGYRDLVSDPALAPPLLTPEGAKVKPDWLYAFLRGPITIRPWLDVRMPTFGLDDAHWNGVIDYFAAISETIGPFRTHGIVPTPGVARVGEELFELLRCQQCHVLDTIPRISRPTVWRLTSECPSNDSNPIGFSMAPGTARDPAGHQDADVLDRVPGFVLSAVR